MNGTEQKTHRTVTTEIANDLRALTEEWRDEFQAACDRLDLHQRQIDGLLQQHAQLRQDVGQQELEIRHWFHKALLEWTDPLLRQFWGRLRWLVWGS